MPANAGRIYCGMGGWIFEPWRGTFYPEKLPKTKELAFAAERVTSIEINGTYYRTQSPETFAKWRSQTPDGFVFSLKGPRYAVNRKVLGEAGESITRFIESGITELGDRLGQIGRGRFRRVPRAAAQDRRRAEAAPRRRSAPRQFLRSRIRRTPQALRHLAGLRRPREIPGHRRCGGRHRLCQTADGPRRGADGIRTCRATARRPRRRRHATCSPTSSTRARCGRRRAPWR